MIAGTAGWMGLDKDFDGDSKQSHAYGALDIPTRIQFIQMGEG
jgi:hypothetical protein